MRRRAELASAGADDDTVAAWFKRHPPTSGFGKVRAAELAINRGEAETGTAALRKAWIEGDFGPFDERGLLARHGFRLRPEDHQARLDRLLWEGQTDAAKRMLPLVSADYRALAEARLAVAADSATAAKLVAKLPEALRNDPGLVFAQARQQRKKDKIDAAAELLLGISSSAHPAAYWEERLVLARRLMSFRQCRDGVSPRRSGSARRRRRIYRGPVPRRLYRAALPQRAGDRVRPFRPYHRPCDQSRCQGPGGILGRPRRRQVGQRRSGDEMVRGRGRAPHDVLRPALGA